MVILTISCSIAYAPGLPLRITTSSDKYWLNLSGHIDVIGRIELSADEYT